MSNVEAVNAEIESAAEEENLQKDRYMTFKCGDEYYGIGISYVEEITAIQPITEVPEMENFVKGLINLRGKIVPVIDVRLRFGKDEIPYNDRTCIMVINVKDTKIGLIIDSIAEVVTIPEAEVVPPPNMGGGTGADRFVYGIGKIGEDVKLLINPTKLIYENMENVEEEGAQADE